MSLQQRAVIVVFDGGTTDTDAAMVRNGLYQFRHVDNVIPCRGVPSLTQAQGLMAKDKLRRELEDAQRKVRELSARLAEVQAAATGPVYLDGHEALDAETTEWKRSS